VKELLLSTVSPDSIFADTPDGIPVGIDFEKLIGEHTLVATQTGFGKSVLLRKVKELALAIGYPMIVLDSDGAFASLRDAAPNGILVAGGEDGDPGITIDETIRRLPQIVAARASVVLDIHGLGDTEQAAIVARVLTVMMKLPKDLLQPYLVVIDEVQRFASQRGMSKAGNAIIKAAKEGRKRGITLLVATQRLADVSKALTSQTKNRLFGHVSDLADRKRVGDEIGISPREAKVFAEFDKGDFLIRGEAFGGPLDRVRIRKPLTGKLGKNEMIEKLRLPISPIDEVRALFGMAASGAPATPASAGGISSPSQVKPLAIHLVATVAPVEDEGSIGDVLLELLAAFGGSGVQKDSLALLAGMTERRNTFQEAFSGLLAGKLVRIGVGAKVRITPEGAASLPAERRAASAVEVLARLRASRDPADERVIACLSAAGHTQLAVTELQIRTGLGPRVLKAALKRLKRDCWVSERRGSFVTSPALARLIGR
jgi:hypothetical protein